MRITSSGNVGIGTTSPNVTLHVEGSVRFKSSTGVSQTYNSYWGGNGNTVWRMDDGLGVQTINLNTSGNTYFNGGNVGIGTLNPGAKLDIGGAAGVDGIRFPDTTIQTTALPKCADNQYIKTVSGKWQCVDIPFTGGWVAVTQPPSTDCSTLGAPEQQIIRMDLIPTEDPITRAMYKNAKGDVGNSNHNCCFPVTPSSLWVLGETAGCSIDNSVTSVYAVSKR